MQMPIPDDWDGLSYCRYAVCWPDSIFWRGILHGLIETPSQGRFWDGDTGSIIETQEAFYPTYQENFTLQEVIMACGDTGLIELAAAVRGLAASACCDGGTPVNGGIQLTIEVGDDIIPLYGSQTPDEVATGEVPVDYPGDLEEYLADKCRTANEMVRNFIQTLRGLANINFAQTNGLGVVVAAAIVGLITVPQFLIPLLFAALIVNVAIGAALRDMADYIEANQDDWICALYNADGTIVASEAVNGLLDIAIAAISVSSVIGVALKTAAQVLLNTDTLNYLYAMVQGIGDEADCSDCFTEVLVMVGTQGGVPAATYISGEIGGEWVFESLYDVSYGSDRLNIFFVRPDFPGGTPAEEDFVCVNYLTYSNTQVDTGGGSNCFFDCAFDVQCVSGLGTMEEFDGMTSTLLFSHTGPYQITFTVERA